MIGTVTVIAEAKFKISPGIKFVTIEEQAILLDSKHGVYLGLDDIGTAIWHEIEQGATYNEICERLFRQYDVTKDVLAGDIHVFVTKLIERGLIETVKI